MPAFGDHGYGLVRRLADGRHHSVSHMATEFGMSEREVVSALAELTEAGMALQKTSTDSYCLNQPLELLQSSRLEEGLTGEARRLLQALDVLGEVDSTNAWLLRQPT